MRNTTLWRAYKECECRKRAARQQYGFRYGIGVDSSGAARLWQRYDRLSKKLERRLEAALQAQDRSEGG